MLNKRTLLYVGAGVIACVSVLILASIKKPIDDKIYDLNSKITVQERNVLEAYNIYKSSELNRKQAKVELEKLYSQKRELMGLSMGLGKSK